MKKKKNKNKNKNKKGIPLVFLVIGIIAIITIIVICIAIIIKKNINDETSKLNMETIELVYGMDGCNAIELPISKELLGASAISNNEAVVRAEVNDNVLKIETISNELKETTVMLEKGKMKKYIKVNVKPSYLVCFDIDGDLDIIMPQKIVYGGNIVCPEAPIKDEEYEFVGWYLNEELTEEYNFDAEVYSDMTVYAKFQNL